MNYKMSQMKKIKIYKNKMENYYKNKKTHKINYKFLYNNTKQS